MKKLKSFKNITLSLLSLTMLFGSVLPVMAANDDESDSQVQARDNSSEKTTKNDNNNNEAVENQEAKNAVDVDFSTLQIGDEFKDYEGITYTVDDLSANIYVGSGDNQKLYPSGSSEIPNFEITYVTKSGEPTFRKYVKLDDLCNLTKNDGTHICEIMNETNRNKGEFFLRRLYKQKIEQSVYDSDSDTMSSREISLYYRSYHNIGTKRFEAMLRLVDGDNDNDVIDTYIFDESNITSNEGTWSTEQSSTRKNEDVSILTTDIETLKDKNGVVYVSLRFVSESLGAEVTWYSKEESKTKDDDDVVIQFYDDKEYCKNIEYTFTSGGEEKDPLEVEKSLYVKETVMRNISLNGTYTYTNNDGKSVAADVDWKKIYILLTVPDTYPDNFFDNNNKLPLGERVVWIENGDKNLLRLQDHVYGKFSDGNCEIEDVAYNCDLGEEVEITGIILYKGVPIPINLFNINNEKCGNTSND